jgi:hypothetical protein
MRSAPIILVAVLALGPAGSRADSTIPTQDPAVLTFKAEKPTAYITVDQVERQLRESLWKQARERCGKQPITTWELKVTQPREFHLIVELKLRCGP